MPDTRRVLPFLWCSYQADTGFPGLYISYFSKSKTNLKPTKNHIADKALQLFNAKGFVNVRLQHIADAAFVSIGHLAYHFRNKDALLEFLYEAMKTDKEKLLNDYKIVPLFEDIHRMLEQLFEHQQTYRFFYTDRLEIARTYPAFLQKHRQHVQWQQIQLEMMLQFNISRGALHISPTPVNRTAILLQRFLDSWLHNLLAEQETAPSKNAFLEDAWAFLNAYFTPMGQNEFQQSIHL